MTMRDKMVTSLLARSPERKVQSRALADLGDAPLPELFSGNMQVEHAEQFSERVV